MTRSIWISRDANGYRWQLLMTGCAMQHHAPELNFSAERRLIAGCTVVAQLWLNQSDLTRTRLFSSEDKPLIPNNRAVKRAICQTVVVAKALETRIYCCPEE